ncbi:MAG: DUF167 domain-containing protein [Isosphaeraceae bacterium]
MIDVTPHANGAIVPVRAQPGAKRDAILGERDGSLRVAVSAPPDKGKANAAIACLLAQSLGVKGSQVELLSGQTSRIKRFLVVGESAESISSKIAALLPPGLLDGRSQTD